MDYHLQLLVWYHQEYNDKGQPKQVVAADADLTSTPYQGTPPSAEESCDIDSVIVTGAREIREKAEERVDARNPCFSGR